MHNFVFSARSHGFKLLKIIVVISLPGLILTSHQMVSDQSLANHRNTQSKFDLNNGVNKETFTAEISVL